MPRLTTYKADVADALVTDLIQATVVITPKLFQEPQQSRFRLHPGVETTKIVGRRSLDAYST